MRVTINYKFKRWDFVHLLPTIVIIGIMTPTFALTYEDKLYQMMNSNSAENYPYLVLFFVSKAVSLIAYGGYIVLSHFRNRGTVKLTTQAQVWIRNLSILTFVYIFVYCLFGLTMLEVIKSGSLQHMQVIAVALMVIYIGYKTYMSPDLFTQAFSVPKKKYVKSGLTPSFSEELRDQLMHLMEGEKVYRQNDISLEKVSHMLGTSRHNTSQVINEHFGLNFFELINKFRIEEALEILKNDRERNLNIIDVAYEVGFNNKVTFNKSFRKQVSLTPTQYLSSLGL